jgi:hypothetical protein
MRGMALAPSKHLKFVTLLLGGTLALSACGQPAGAAAIVDGKTVSEQNVQTVSTQLNTLAQGQQKLTPSTVLLNLILAPYVLAEAERAGKGVSDAEARKVIAKVPNPSPATMDFVRMQLAIPSLSTEAKAAILTKIAKAKITVNPRYGTFDAKQVALAPTAPNWIRSSTQSAAK